MYAWIWQHLPGPVPLRALIALLFFAVIVVVLFLVVFPVLDAWLPIDQSDISGASAPG